MAHSVYSKKVYVLCPVCSSCAFYFFMPCFPHSCCLPTQVCITRQAISQGIYLLTSSDDVPVCQVWMCGGHLLISTCSHVGHVFRRFCPHKFPGGIVGGLRIIRRNMERMVNVWLDPAQRDVFYLSNGKLGTGACRGGWLWMIPCMGDSVRG